MQCRFSAQPLLEIHLHKSNSLKVDLLDKMYSIHGFIKGPIKLVFKKIKISLEKCIKVLRRVFWFSYDLIVLISSKSWATWSPFLASILVYRFLT